jgi:hypothetical protein
VFIDKLRNTSLKYTTSFHTSSETPSQHKSVAWMTDLPVFVNKRAIETCKYKQYGVPFFFLQKCSALSVERVFGEE